MRRRSPRTERLRTATAWVLALLCLWMGTVGVLHHTDDSPMAASSASPVAAWGHATAAAPPDNCAACQWTQGMQFGTLTVCQVALPLTFTAPRARPLVRPCVCPPPRHCSPRAPPPFLS